MTLTTHAIVGAAVASLIPTHPALGFVAAFASHFAIDAIPHWDYPISSASINPDFGAAMKYDSAFLADVLRIGTDLLLGIAVSVLVFSPISSFGVVLLGACAGILPDPLQFVYAHFPHEPLISLQGFHRWIHTKNHMKKMKLFGIASQVLFVVVLISLMRAFVR